jgi:hypothetical protein
MSLRPPSTRAAGQRPTSATSSSGSKGSDSFAFTPDQRVSIREWIDGGLAVLKAAQLQNNSNALFSLESAGPSLGVNSQNSSVGPSFLQRPRSAKGVAANNNAGASKPTPTQAAVESQFLKFQVLSASLDSLAHESAVNNEEQFEQLTIRLLVRVILCLGISFHHLPLISIRSAESYSSEFLTYLYRKLPSFNKVASGCFHCPHG